MLLPENVSTYGAQIDRLFWAILWITGLFFLLVQGGLLYFTVKYRARPGKRASYVHGNTVIEIVWTVIPALILVALTVCSQRLWVELRSPGRIPPSAMPVRILAEQFAWNIRYPGPDQEFQTPDDVTALNQLHLPVGKPVLIQLESKDVIHSLFMPEFRVKQDAVPGLTTQVWVEATKAGEYEIRCAEFCGLGHYRMRGFVTTDPPEAFEKWLRETQANE
ncbi:MAG: cytochrome c oxidase subunit II [Candidatus Omnitrophica bacterium]|nr:cytochrome c oxidase subunit II [Candidatus Omnitrophota bacterium]